MFHLRRLLEDPEPKPVQIPTGEPRPERPFSTPENEPHWYKSTHEPEPDTIMPEIMTNSGSFPHVWHFHLCSYCFLRRAVDYVHLLETAVSNNSCCHILIYL